MSGSATAHRRAPDRGSLVETPFARLLLQLYGERYTGELHLERDGIEKRILLQRGIPVFAESTAPDETVARSLARSGKIGGADARKVAAAVAKRKCKEETALLALGLVDAKGLYDALRLLVRQRLLDAFGWDTGRFALRRDAPAPADARAMRCDPIGLAHEGVAIHWSPARVRESLAECLDRFPVPSERAGALIERLVADPESRELCARLDGTEPLAAACGSASPVAWAALWVLIQAHAFEFRSAPATQTNGAETEGAPPAPEFEIVVGAASPPAEEAPRAEARGAANPAKAAGDSAFRDEILSRHATLRETDYYALLGVASNASAGAVKRAYFQLAKRYHPDALARQGLVDVKEEAKQVFAAIAKAYETLSDAKRRRAYDEELESGGNDQEVARLVQAETLYRKAEILLRAGQFGPALEFLRPCVELWPDDATYQAALGWALYRKAPPELQEARTHLELAVKLDARAAEAHQRLGLVLRELGEHRAAESLLAKAKVLDPKLS